MNVSGKSLQDIYDAGAKRLEDLAEAQRSNFNNSTEAHLDERSRVEPDHLKSLEERSEELEEEIRSYLEKGVERVERTIDSQVTENDKYLSRLVDSLTLLAKRFNESVGELKESAEFKLKDMATDAEELYRRQSDRVSSDLHRQGSASVDECRSAGTDSMNELHAKVEDNMQSSIREENEAKNRLYNSFTSYVASVKTTMADALLALNESHELACSNLSTRAEQGRKGISSYVDKSLSESDNTSSDCETRLRRSFSKSMDDTSTAFDDSASRALSDLVGLHEASMADLSMKSQELSRDMDSLSESARQSIKNRDQQARGRGADLMEHFTEELSTKAESSVTFQSNLEKERQKMVKEIWDELQSVQDKFQEKLSGLAKSLLDKLERVCSEAESAILTAQELCVEESKGSARNRQSTIDQLTKEFLDKVDTKRKAALSGIDKAAGGRKEKEEAVPELIGSAAEPDQPSKSVSEDDSDSSEEPSEDAQGNDEAEDNEEDDPDRQNPRPAQKGRRRKKPKAGSDNSTGDDE